MSDLEKAARMAMEAICGSGDFLFNFHDCEPNNEREMQAYQAALAANEKAFNALRQALEQPAQQKPVDWEAVAADQAMTIAMMKAEQEAAVLAEREACAQVCDDRDMGDCNREDMEARACAAAIRERNNP